MKTFKEYDEACREFDNHFDINHRLLKLMEEVGELVQCFNKGYTNEIIMYELGDVMFQLSRIARLNSMTLEDVAENNIKKLKYREEFGR